MIRATRYVLIFSAPLAVAMALLGLSYLVLERTGETIDPVRAAKIQQERDIRYGSALYYRPRPYKIERARLATAEVVLLGSSRAMQFVGAPWRIPAINAGGAMRDLGSGEIFLDALLADAPPRQVILMLDWWWFGTARRPDDPAEATPDTPVTLRELLAPFTWLWQGGMTPTQVQNVLIDPAGLKPAIGMPAMFKNAGWDAFGHYDYGDMLGEQAGGPDIGFAETLKDIARTSKNNDRGPWNAFSAENWQRLEAMVARLQEAGVEVILVLPPVAPPVFDWLAAQPEPNLVKEVQRRLGSLPALSFDFHDPKSIGTNQCEFVDGTHGGEVTYLRILDAVAADPSSHLEGAIDRALIRNLIAGNAGRAMVARDDPDRAPEADFNSLGCLK